MVRYKDSIPQGWCCRQTYLRNHHTLNAAIEARLAISPELASIRVLQVGPGVIEPILLTTLLQRRGLNWELVVVDASEDVIESLSRTIRHPQPLQLLDVASKFPGAEAELCDNLVDPQRLELTTASLAELNLLASLGLADDAKQAASELIEHGLPSDILSKGQIELHSGKFSEVDVGGEFDLIVSNFSIQYEVYEGRTQEVCRALDRCLRPRGLLAHAANYAAQAQLLDRLHRVYDWPFVYGLREIQAVHYHDDSKGVARLRMRTDSLCARPDSRPELAMVSEHLLPPAIPRDSPEPFAVTLPDDGLVREMVTTHAWPHEEGQACGRARVEELLSRPSSSSFALRWRS